MEIEKFGNGYTVNYNGDELYFDTIEKAESFVKMMKSFEHTMQYHDMEIAFLIDTYADMFERRAVIAYCRENCGDWEMYGDITINIPQYSLEDDECFLSNDCTELIKEMVNQGYLKIVDSINVNMGRYNIGKFTEKFEKEFNTEEK